MANKLELTWYGKDEPILVEPRLLIENAALLSAFLLNRSSDLDSHPRGQPFGAESPGEQVCRTGEVHLHRSALQHWLCV